MQPLAGVLPAPAMEARGCLDDETLERLFGGELSRDEIARLDRHIDRCPSCRARVSSLATTAPVPLAPASEGRTVDARYDLRERVGAGGMAEIFRAVQRSTGRDVALKIPISRSRDDWARFEREAAMLVALDHEAIVKHLAEGHADDGTPFLVMEWLEGEDLAARLRRGQLSVEETLVVADRIARALAATHAAGLVHRDIKPSNIFLQNARVEGATLIDFGIARRVFGLPTTALTRTGMLLGTLGYMAPEQALGAKTVGPRADVFSLGCVLFECLTGQRAFGGAHAVEVLAKSTLR